MIHWSQRRLIAVLAIAVIAVMEPVSWITASIPPCIIDASAFAPDFTEQYSCPTLWAYVLSYLRAALAFLSQPYVATALVPVILAASTLFLWWFTTRRLARSAVESARAARTSADALMAAEQAQVFTVFDTGNIPQILSELGRVDPGELGGGEERRTASGRLFVKFVCKNYGRTTAFLKEVSHDLQYWTKLPPFLRYAASPDLPRERAVVAGASTEPIQCTLLVPVTSAMVSSIRAGESFLWVFGRVVYEDSFGRDREHRFLCRYHVGYGFQPYEHEDFNRNT